MCSTALLAVTGCKNDEKPIDELPEPRIFANDPDLLPVGGGNLTLPTA